MYKRQVEKSYFVPDPGCKLVSFDYSNADARIVAGYAPVSYTHLFLRSLPCVVGLPAERKPVDTRIVELSLIHI